MSGELGRRLGTNLIPEPRELGTDLIGGWDPSQESSLVARWKADTGTVVATGVSDWATKNPANTYTLSQGLGGSQPVLTSSNAAFGNKATIGGTGAYYLQLTSLAAGRLKNAFTGTAAHSCWFVTRLDSGSSDAAQYLLWTFSDGTNNERIFFQRPNSTTKLRYQRTSGGVSQTFDTTSNVTAASSKASYLLTYDGANATWYKDGVVDTASAAKGQTPAAPTTIDAFTNVTHSNYWVGDTAEVCFFDAALSAATIANLEAYCLREYGF